MSKSYHYTDEELKFIEQNWKAKTDKEIARILDRTEESVARQRKRFGWIKTPGRPSSEIIDEGLKEMAEAGISPFSMANLDKDQRLQIYKHNFTKNPRYSTLLKELHTDEIDYYKHKYVEFMDSVDTVTIQEEDSLHHMIMADVSISRLRRRIRDMEQKNEEEDKALIFGLYEMLDKHEKKFVEYQRILRVTREGRLKENKEEKETFASLVQVYRNKKAREEFGRQAGLMEIYKEKCKEEMKASRYLLGE